MRRTQRTLDFFFVAWGVQLRIRFACKHDGTHKGIRSFKKDPARYPAIPASIILHSYKEMTCQDPLLNDPQVEDWTTLDYVLAPLGMKTEISIKGSTFQQAVVNTRHLPLVLQIRTRIPTKISLKSEPKLGFSHTTEFYAQVEAELLHVVGNSFELPISNSYCEAFTDGSCPNNRVVGPDNPAGWGFALTTDTSPIVNPGPARTWLTSRGPVKTQPTDDSILPEIYGSNNTGELRALIELVDYLLHYSQLPRGSHINIHTDSQYAMRLILGDSVPTTHHQLVALAQQYYTAIRTQYRVVLHKVEAHVGIYGNELADSLAKAGVTSFGNLGRFQGPRTRPLNPPDIGFNQDDWKALGIEEQSRIISELLKPHLPAIPKLQLSQKKNLDYPENTRPYCRNAPQHGYDLSGAQTVPEAPEKIG